ncbi:ashwin-like [Biomphalaria glabrata]|uniref:Ashwin n=1 Tax=Biomphalaria glabrata TaxID=6526 RepID=A0A2C9KJ17_BIOGL|nr:ashwin-like [Biomphalaria glabrata]
MSNTLPSNSVPSKIDWLYPDLMSKDGLLYILKQRYIDQHNYDLENLNKEDLIDLYNQYILPLPQRKYRSNRRGNEMCKKQIISSKKRASEFKDDSDQPAKRQQMITMAQGSGDRLKPPPSSASGNNKVVKLSHSKNTYQLPETEFKEKCNMNSQGKQCSNNQNQGCNSRKRHFKDDNHSDQLTNTSPSPIKKINKISWP